MGIVREISPELDPVEFPDNMDEAAVDAFMAQRGRELRQGLITRRQAQLAAETEGEEALRYQEGGVPFSERVGSTLLNAPQSAMRQTGQTLRGLGEFLATAPIPRERGEIAPEIVRENIRRAQRPPAQVEREVEASPTRRLGGEMVAAAPEVFPTLPGVRESLPSQVSGGIGSVGALLPAGLTGPAAPFVGGAMYGWSAGEDFADDAEQVVNSRIAEALAQGNTALAADLERRKFDMKNTARMAGRAIGAGTEGVLGLAGKIRVGKSQIGGIGKRLAERMVPKSAPVAVQNAVRGAVEGGLTEAAQEGTEQILGNAAALAVYDPTRGIMDDVAQSVVVGGLTGKVVGGAFGSKRDPRDPLPASRAAAVGEVVPGTEIPQDIGAPDLTLEDLGDLLPAEEVVAVETPVPATQETPENIDVSQETPVPEAPVVAEATVPESGPAPAPETPAVDLPTLSPATAAETPVAPETPASQAPSSSVEGVMGSVQEIRNQDAKLFNQWQSTAEAAMDPMADSLHEANAKTVPESIRDRFTAHGLRGFHEDTLASIIANGLTRGSEGPVISEPLGGRNTKSGAPLILLSKPDQTIQSAGIGAVVVNRPWANQLIPALQKKYPGVLFISPGQLPAYLNQTMPAPEKPKRTRKAKRVAIDDVAGVEAAIAPAPVAQPAPAPTPIPPDDTAMEAATAAAMAGRAPAPVRTAPDTGIAERAAVDAAMEQATRRASETPGAAAMNRAPEEGVAGQPEPTIPPLPTELAEAIAADEAPDVFVENAVRKFGEGERAYATNSTKPNERQRQVLEQGKRIAAEKGWDWNKVKETARRQLGLNENFLKPDSRADQVFQMMREEDAAAAKRNKRTAEEMARIDAETKARKDKEAADKAEKEAAQRKQAEEKAAESERQTAQEHDQIVAKLPDSFMQYWRNAKTKKVRQNLLNRVIVASGTRNAEALTAAMERRATAGSNPEPEAQSLTPKQYHKAINAWRAKEYGVPVSEVEENYPEESNKQDHWSAVNKFVERGGKLDAKILDSLDEEQIQYLQRSARASIPEGYLSPAVRAKNKAFEREMVDARKRGREEAKREVPSSGSTTPKIEEEAKVGPVIYDSGIPARPFALQKGEKPAPGDLLFATREEAESEFANAARIEATNKASREKWQAKEAQEKAEKAAREDLDGYEATLSPMQRARAVKALTKAVKYKGKEQSIRDVIRGMVADGATVKEDRLERPDGSFLGQKTLTKMGLDYARHLAAKREPTITSTPAAEPPAAQAAEVATPKNRRPGEQAPDVSAAAREANESLQQHAKQVVEVVEPLERELRKADSAVAEIGMDWDSTKPGAKKRKTQKSIFQKYNVTTKDELNALYKERVKAANELRGRLDKEKAKAAEMLRYRNEANEAWTYAVEINKEIAKQQKEDEAEFAKEGKLTQEQSLDLNELGLAAQKKRLGVLSEARLAWLESKATQPDILERALNAAISATDRKNATFSDPFLIAAVGLPVLNAALRIVRRVYLKTRDLARAKRQGMRLIRRQLRTDPKADLPRIEEAFNQLVEGTAEKPGPDQIEAFQAADGTRRQKSRGLFTGDVTVDTDAEWQAGAERWINQFNGNIRRAFEAARSTDYATTGLNPAAQNYVFGRLLEMSEIAINAARNDVDMVRNINLQKEIADASRDSAAEAAKALGSRALVQKRILWMYPILDYRKLIQEAQKRLPFPDVVADEVRTWLQESGRKAVQEMRNAMTDADKVFARELKTTVRDMRVVWRDVMTASVESQEAMRRKILEELVKAPELKGLSRQGYIDIANLLGKAWEKERARIFAAEFRKQVPLPSVKEDVRRKLFTAIPDILKWANLGLLDNEAFRNAVAPKFGVAKFDGETAKKLNTMAQRAQKVGGVNRDEIIKDMYRLMQTEGGVRWQDLLRDYWFASVLTALDTQLDNVMGIINGQMLTAMGMAMAKPEVRKIMGKAYTDGFYEGVKDFWPILSNGEFARSINFNTEQPSNTLEAIGESKNRFARMLQIGKYTGRFMEAINNINALSVNQATAAWALSNRYPIEHVRRYMMPSEKVRQAAIDKAKAEGTRPELMMKRVRQIIQESIPVEVLLSAKEISDIAGYTNQPTGVAGVLYRMLGDAEKRLTGFKFVTGTQFARFATNLFNQSLNFVAPVALARYWASSPGRQNEPYGLKFGEEHRKLILAQAAFGTALAAFAAALFLGDDDDEKDRFIDINGSFKSLPDGKRKQLLSEGRLPYSIRIGDKYVSYRQLPFAVVLSAIGELRDRQLFAKDQWDQESIIRKFGDGMAAGVLTIKDAPAIASFTEFLGVANAYKFDPSEQIEKSWPRYLAKLSGSFIPRALKQVDAWADPSIYKANTGHEFFLQQLPFARRTLGEGPILNVLGEPVEVERYPWSRWLRTRKDDKAWSTLGELASNGVFLPVPSVTVKVMENGRRREMTPSESYRYQKRVGKAYRKFIEDNAERLLRMKPDEANEFIKNRTEQLRERLRNTKDA